MSARGTMVYPTGSPYTDTVGWWRCRFVAADDGTVDDAAVLRLLARVGQRMTWVHVQKLRVSTARRASPRRRASRPYHPAQGQG